MYFDAGSPLAVVSENFMRIRIENKSLGPPCFWLRRLFENAISRYINYSSVVFTQRRVALRFRSTTFRKRGRVATAKVTFSSKSAPVLCKRNAVLLLFSAVFRPIRSSVNVVLYFF